MNGPNTIVKNLRVLADEADAIRSRSARLVIHLQLMADQIEAAILKQRAEEQVPAEQKRS